MFGKDQRNLPAILLLIHCIPLNINHWFEIWSFKTLVSRAAYSIPAESDIRHNLSDLLMFLSGICHWDMFIKFSKWQCGWGIKATVSRTYASAVQYSSWQNVNAFPGRLFNLDRGNMKPAFNSLTADICCVPQYSSSLTRNGGVLSVGCSGDWLQYQYPRPDHYTGSPHNYSGGSHRILARREGRLVNPGVGRLCG